MAQIRIEEKKSGSILPWILGLLLLGLAIWGIAEAFEESDELELTETEEYIEDESVVGNDIDDDIIAVNYDDEFEEFLSYTADMEGEMGLDHEFSHRALSLLAAATLAVSEDTDSDNQYGIDGKMQQVMSLADEITEDPYATDHPDKLRMAALLITESLGDLDQNYFNGVAGQDIQMLRKEAQDITANTLTLNQKEDVRSFFGAARNVLAKMEG